MCYSDISALYGARQIDTDKWPYASADNSLEYPVLTGVVTYLTGYLSMIQMDIAHTLM